MKGPAYLSQPNLQRLPVLLKEVQEGQILLPRFQRPFVWTPEQRLQLFDSIYQGMPIGSLLVWRTHEHDLESYDWLGHLPLRRTAKQDNGKNEVKQYLLDGHQRLTTLYSALGEGLLASEEVAREPVDEAESWAVYFDLVGRIFVLPKKRGAPPATWLPLAILLDPFRLYEFQKRLLETGADRSLLNRAEALASTFKDYTIPVVPIVTENLELVTEGFQRINNAGTRMDQVHMVNALTWSPDFDLNRRMGEIKEELGEVGWQDLEEKLILFTCKAAMELDLYDSALETLRTKLRQQPEVLTEVTRYLKATARFLRDCCHVHGPETLPYSFQIVLLADAIRLGTCQLDRPLSPKLEKDLSRWFWLTTYAEHFTGTSSTRLRKTLDHLHCVVLKGEDSRPADLSTKVGPVKRFDPRAARSRAFALRLAELGPRNADGRANDAFQLLASEGRDAVPTLIPSREIESIASAKGPENRIIAHPKEIAQLRRLLRERTRDCDPEILRSHAIEPDAAEALARGDVPAFFAHRHRRLVDLERAFVEPLGLEYVDEL